MCKNDAKLGKNPIYPVLKQMSFQIVYELINC